MEALQLGQEDYIWAMRKYFDRDEEDAFRKSLAYCKSRKQLKPYQQQPEERKTAVMASLVPDEVIYNVDNYEHRRFDACFLFGDVSGFTELCEKYTKTGPSGPSRMTHVLNQYIGSMVQEVLSHGGDVLKFSGDAFLASFNLEDDRAMRDCIHAAIDCALMIQKNYGSFLTDVGVIIRVKLAISAGLVSFALIGDASNSHYVVVGKPIWDVKAAEHISVAGDIIVAPAAWNLINLSEYVYLDMPDNVHIKITSVGANWRSVQKNVLQTNPEVKSEGASEDSSDTDSEDSIITRDGDDFLLRPSVNYSINLRMKQALTRYIIKPVMKSIDMEESFEYLTEMRQAVIVFINVISETLDTEKTVTLAHETYKIVCKVVDKFDGCVNKVSLFDKDLMFVVIFGLRGAKHELECQIALKCAKECHSEISNLPGVLSASIGVTTGNTYCGVVGHTLRREYTVISLIVNKAARLMVAYKGKVTCDKQTFLNSKLDAKNFILQEYKYLKGISDPGPVYEYAEDDCEHAELFKLNPRPLLSCDEYLNLYLRMINFGRSQTELDQQHRMLLICGKARQGKSRLLDEIIYITPNEISMIKIRLAKRHRTWSFKAIELIFSGILRFTSQTTSSEKERILEKKLRNRKLSNIICFLNDVFGVKFPKSYHYSKATPEVKLNTLKKLIRNLGFAVIAIDDSDYMDYESTVLLGELFYVKTIVFVFTKGSDRTHSWDIETNFQNNAVFKFVLKPIPTLYVSALICQLLNVYAVSSQLENVIQNRSNGNPGWIESFLITLIHEKSIVLVKATFRQIHDLGLVCPPPYLAYRWNEEQKKEYQNTMEERTEGTDSITNVYYHWDRYVDCCRDSNLDIASRGKYEIAGKESVPVCVITKTFQVPESVMELSNNTTIIKTFDSLNCFEQLVIKCSAVLGNQFLRDMLLYIMTEQKVKDTALAIKKLFEIRVLACAKGDFTTDSTVLKERLAEPGSDGALICHCKGLPIDEVCRDLPKYASCGYLQFQSSSFRDITYNLLTEQQKKDFHLRALRYLERETRKCRPCGRSYFENLLYTKANTEVLSITKARKPPTINLLDRRDSASSTHSRESAATTSITGSLSRRSMRSAGAQSSNSFESEKRKTRDLSSYRFGLTLLRALRKRSSLTRTFSNEDFSECRCNWILCTAFAQLVEHCLAGEEYMKAVQAMIEYSRLSISLCNVTLALKMLDRALEELNRSCFRNMENPWKVNLLRGRIYILIGQCKIYVGEIECAYDYLHKALAQYQIKFPRGVRKHIKIFHYQLKHLFALYVLPRSVTKKLDRWERWYFNDLAECLSSLFTIYQARGEYANAELAALWSVIKALQAFTNFKVICIAMTNLLLLSTIKTRSRVLAAFELYSLRLCHWMGNSPQIDDLKCVAKLYTAVFMIRLYFSRLNEALTIGFVVFRLCAAIQGNKIILPLMPYLVDGLLIKKRLTSIYALLQNMLAFAEDEMDLTGKLWYYISCIQIQIMTGFTVLSIQLIESLYRFVGLNWKANADMTAVRRFVVLMWLWFIRNEKYEAARSWEVEHGYILGDLRQNDKDQTTALYFMEGLLIRLAYESDKRNVSMWATTEAAFLILLKESQKFIQHFESLKPRHYHIKAYYYYIKRDADGCKACLHKARRLAEKQENFYELGFLEHSFFEVWMKAWEKALASDVLTFWRDHSETDFFDFQDIDGTGNFIGYYTFPGTLYAFKD